MGSERWDHDLRELTAAMAPLSLASVKMSTSWEASVALASHETRAIQGVVADDRGIGTDAKVLKG